LVEATIQTARELPADSYRGWTLASFLPKLVELGAADTALTIAREARAIGSLVELTPPGDREALIEEAAREVRGSRFELEKAWQLARLSAFADAAAADGLRAEALTVARAFSREVRGRGALTAVVQHLPVDHRDTVLEEAISGAREIEDAEMRAQTLTVLAPLAPGEEGTRLAAEALDAVAGMPDEVSRGRALGSLAPELSPSLLDRALALMEDFRDDLWLGRALEGVLPALAAAGRPEQALDRTLAASSSVRGRVLASLGAHLTGPLLDRALTAADSLDPYERGAALAGLGPQLAALGRPTQALELIVTIAQPDSRAAALRAAAPSLAGLPISDLAPTWVSALQTLGGRDRVNLLSDLGALAPVIAALGGPQAIRATAAAVVDIGAWFP